MLRDLYRQIVSDGDGRPWWIQLEELERKAFVQRGVFEPMFDEAVTEDAFVESAAWERANEEGDRSKRFQYIAEVEEARERQEARQRMLLVERFVDELPETLKYMRHRAAAHFDRVERGLRVDTVDSFERVLFKLAGKLAAEVMRERMRELEAAARLGRSRGNGTNGVENAAEELLNDWVWKIRRFMDRLRPTPREPTVQDPYGDRR